MILIKLACFFKRFSNQRLETFCQVFSWTSVGPSKCPINKMIGLQDHLRVWAYPWVQHYIIQRPFQSYLETPQHFFWKSLKIKIRHCRNFQCPLSKISVHYQTVIDQRLTVFHQLFSWTLVGPSKCPINKMNGSQNHLRVWEITWMPCVLSENSFTKTFLKVIKIWN